MPEIFLLLPVHLQAALLEREPGHSYEFQRTIASALVLAHFLRFNVSDRPFFQRGILPDGGADWRYTTRLAEVASFFLAQLRDPTASVEWASRWKRDDLDSIFAESRAATLFSVEGFTVTPRPVCGVKGEDYDFDVSKDGQTFPVEVTSSAKIASSSAIFRKLNNKRPQLPKGRDGIIVLVRFGDVENPEPLFNAFEIASERVLRGTTCVAACFMLSEFGVEGEDGWGAMTVPSHGLIKRPSDGRETALGAMVEPTTRSAPDHLERLLVELDALTRR